MGSKVFRDSSIGSIFSDGFCGKEGKIKSDTPILSSYQELGPAIGPAIGLSKSYINFKFHIYLIYKKKLTYQDNLSYYYYIDSYNSFR